MEDCNKHIRGKISTRLPDISDREDQQSSKTLYATKHTNKHCEHVRLRTPTNMYGGENVHRIKHVLWRTSTSMYDGEIVHAYQACAMENFNTHV